MVREETSTGAGYPTHHHRHQRHPLPRHLPRFCSPVLPMKPSVLPMNPLLLPRAVLPSPRGGTYIPISPKQGWRDAVLRAGPGMQRVLSVRDLYILQRQVREKGKIKSPAAPFHPWPHLASASHLSGVREVCGVRCRDCSPADTWRDQDPVLSKVMKCEPFPSVIFNALNPATVLLRLW